MNVRFARNSIFALTTFALCGSLAIAQQPPEQPAPGTPAPIERHPPSDQGGPRSGMMQGQHSFGPRDGFHHGFEGRPMDGSFHIGPAGMWWKNPRIVQRLSLTAEQTKKMDDIFQQSRIQLIDLKANVEKQQVMLEPLLSANSVDTTKTLAQIDKVADARAELEKANAKMLLGIRGVLTPDQWTKLRDHRFGEPDAQAAPGGGQTHRGMHGGPPPGASNLIDPIDQP